MKARTWILLLMALVVTPVVAHVPDLYASVHFNSAHPDFGMLPRKMMITYRGEHYSRPDSREYSQDPPPDQTVEEYGNDNREQWAEIHRVRLLKKAEQQQYASNWKAAAATLRDVGERYGWRRGIRDRYAVLLRVAPLPRPIPDGVAHALSLYIRGMDLVQSPRAAEAEKTFADAASVPGCGFVREHALYQAASVKYELRDWPGAIAAYERLLADVPATELREPALMMIARCALLPKGEKNCNIEVGRRALDELEQRYGSGRFKGKTLGLRGRIALLTGHYGDAVHIYLAAGDLESVGYIRKLVKPEERGRIDIQLLAGYLMRMQLGRPDQFERAVVMVDRTRKRLSPSDAYRFSQRLIADPELASAYLYYRLYHTDLHKGDLETLSQLAGHLLHRRSAASLSPAVRTRLAELHFQRREYAKAIGWTDGVLARSGADPTGRALYVRGASLHKLNRPRQALAAFRGLLDRYPKSGLRRAARENVAILYEALGDLPHALDQYFELGYDEDVAFMVDIRMEIPQLEAYYRSRPDMRLVEDSDEEEYVPGSLGKMRRKPARSYARSRLLAYSIGIRYLRKERWADARKWLSMVPRKALYQPTPGYSWYTGSADPLKALKDLSALHHAIQTAGLENARAAAMYRYARYYYTHSDELLYNAPLWKGWRAMGFQFLWNERHATREDVAAARVHHYEHDIYARSLHICVELARKYPHSPYAPKALYRAACAERKLANFNGWWRHDNKRQNHFFAAERLMKRLVRLYPHHPLAAPGAKYAHVFREEGSGDLYD